MSRNDIKEEGTLMEKKLQNIELGGKAAILDKVLPLLHVFRHH